MTNVVLVMSGDIKNMATMTAIEGQQGMALRKYIEGTGGGDFGGVLSGGRD